jgi:hypothetical protein
MDKVWNPSTRHGIQADERRKKDILFYPSLCSWDWIGLLLRQWERERERDRDSQPTKPKATALLKWGIDRGEEEQKRSESERESPITASYSVWCGGVDLLSTCLPLPETESFPGYGLCNAGLWPGPEVDPVYAHKEETSLIYCSTPSLGCIFFCFCLAICHLLLVLFCECGWNPVTLPY